MPRRQSWFLAGLFLTTLTTLCLEVMDTRLLSVMTWYHLSFFAVSVAMFGMAAGALRVYLGGARFEGENALRALRRYGVAYAISIPASHVLALRILIPEGFSFAMAAALLLLTVTLAVPFFLSGILVAIALTRIPGRIGLVYAVDLVGAALGCLLLVPLLQWTNISSVALILGGLAALGALCFQVFTGPASRFARVGTALLAGAFAVGGILNPDVGPTRLGVVYSKGKERNFESISYEAWNVHAQLSAGSIEHDTLAPFWGPGLGFEQYSVDRLWLLLDGEAGTMMTAWDGSRDGLAWVKHDVTAIPYFLRRGGEAAVIGVGGGRDILTALWGEHRVTGIEINRAFLDLLEGEHRDFAGLADRPDVRLVHDEARSYLTRTPERFDVVQMSLIDTWAATGAGAFTLTENGLYTVEAWRVFLRVLKPDGILSVSRWFDPRDASETSRLIALGVATLLDAGVDDPSRHMAVLSQMRVATLLLSPLPLSEADLAKLHETAEALGHTILMAPGVVSPEARLDWIARSRSLEELAAAVEHPAYDYSPPRDERPYFFNILKPAYAMSIVPGDSPGILSGNLIATSTLVVLAAITFFLVIAVILVPLVVSGMPSMGAGSFLACLLYFVAIGLGFMLVQVPYMQRFSVYLGHPIYAVVVTLFSMILFAGLGSLVSDRLPVERRPLALFVFPVLIAGALLAQLAFLQQIIENTIRYELLERCLVVIGLVAPVSLLLGLCFPIGIRLVDRISHDAAPWMWGVNGAAGVLGAVVAVGISMWTGIHNSLRVALALYAALAVLAPVLWWIGSRQAAGHEAAPSAPPVAP